MNKLHIPNEMHVLVILINPLLWHTSIADVQTQLWSIQMCCILKHTAAMRHVRGFRALRCVSVQCTTTRPCLQIYSNEHNVVYINILSFCSSSKCPFQKVFMSWSYNTSNHLTGIEQCLTLRLCKDTTLCLTKFRLREGLIWRLSQSSMRPSMYLTSNVILDTHPFLEQTNTKQYQYTFDGVLFNPWLTVY